MEKSCSVRKESQARGSLSPECMGSASAGRIGRLVVPVLCLALAFAACFRGRTPPQADSSSARSQSLKVTQGFRVPADSQGGASQRAGSL